MGSKVSVIIAAYNGEKCIELALDSVFSQTLPGKDYEIIVVNDGSTDNTPDILRKYEDRITVITQPNLGLAAACNHGIAESKGDYLIRLDADDYFHRDILQSTASILDSLPEYHCVYTDRYEIRPPDSTEEIISVGENNVFDMAACGIMFRKDVFYQIGLYRDILFEEYDMMLRFFDSGLKGHYLPQPLYYYMINDSGITGRPDYWEEGWKQLRNIWDKEKLREYIDIQVKLKGKSRFSLS